MPHRPVDKTVLSQKTLEALEKELERRKRRVESTQIWLRQQFRCLEIERDNVAVIEALIEDAKATRH